MIIVFRSAQPNVEDESHFKEVAYTFDVFSFSVKEADNSFQHFSNSYTEG